MIWTAWLIFGAAAALQEAPPEPDRLIRRLGAPRFAHGNLLTASAVSPDGRLLATADGKSLRVWDLESGRLNFEIVASGRCVAFSRDGALLAAGAARDMVVHDSATGAHLYSTRGHLKSVLSASFSPDATRLATASDDVTVRVWDLKAGTELFRIEDHLNSVYAVAYSPDGTLLATGSRDGTVRLWSAENGKPIRTLQGHGDDVRALAFSLDGATLASAGGDAYGIPGNEDRAIRIWDVSTGAAKATWPGHARVVTSLALSSDGKTLASGGVDGNIRVWEFPGGTLRRSIRAGTTVKSLSFAKDGSKVAVAGDAQVPLLFDVATGEEVSGHVGHRASVQSLQVVDGGTRLIAGDLSGEILVWDLKTEKVVRRIAAHAGSVNRSVASPDGKKIASVGQDRSVVIWNVEDGKEIARIPVDSEWTMFLQWWRDEDAVMVGTRGKGLELHDAKTGKHLRSIPGLTVVTDAAFSADGETMAIAERYCWVRVRATASDETRTLIKSPSGVASIAIHPSGRWVVGSSSGFLVHDLAEGRTSDLSYMGYGPYRPVFSPDGRWVAGLSWTKGLRVVELASAQVVAEFPLKPLRYTDCAFLPGGRRLVSGTEGTTLAIWSLDSNLAAEAGKDLETLWREMGDGGFPAAIDALVARGDAAVAFLKERLGAKADEKEIARILGDIAGKDGETRRTATAELVVVGADGEAPLDRAIEAEKDAVRREGLIQAREELLAPIVKSSSTLRKLRAQEVLERIGSADARAILKSLSESAPSRRERFEAGLALKRLK